VSSNVRDKKMEMKNKEYKKELRQYKLQIDAYRALNENLMYQASHNYDKYLISLSAGALALSLTFLSTILKDIVLCHPWLLYTSWILWGITIVCILYSFMTSCRSHSITIDQVDNNTIHDEKPGRHFSLITIILGWVAGISFLIATIAICFFVGLNMKGT
jgi:hypothetical protein